MLRKITLVAAIALVLGTISSVAYSAGTASREASGDPVRTRPLSLDAGREVRAAIKSCPAGNVTLSCVNKNFNKLRKAFNKLVTAHNTLGAFVVTCLQRASVTQYGDGSGSTFGYMWDDDGNGAQDFDTSALDFTVPGGAASAQMVVAVC